MPVHCAACGEELLGAVNRCWRCGRTFAHAPTPESEPPVRRSALPAALVVAPVPADSCDRGTLVDDTPAAVVADLSSDSAADSTAAHNAAAHGTATTAAWEAEAQAATDEGRLRVVDLSAASRWGSPFREGYYITWSNRCRVWFRVPREWLNQWRERTKAAGNRRAAGTVGARDSGRATGGPAAGNAGTPPSSVGSLAISPVRAVLSDASLVLAVVLGVASFALLQYPLIAVLIAGLGLGMALASLAARIRWRALLVVLLCLTPMAVLAAREYQAWRAAQAQAEAELWEE